MVRQNKCIINTSPNKNHNNVYNICSCPAQNNNATNNNLHISEGGMTLLGWDEETTYLVFQHLDNESDQASSPYLQKVYDLKRLTQLTLFNFARDLSC